MTEAELKEERFYDLIESMDPEELAAICIEFIMGESVRDKFMNEMLTDYDDDEDDDAEDDYGDGTEM